MMHNNAITIDNMNNYKRYMVLVSKTLEKNASFKMSLKFYKADCITLLTRYLESSIAEYEFEYTDRFKCSLLDIKNVCISDYLDDLEDTYWTVSKVASILS